MKEKRNPDELVNITFPQEKIEKIQKIGGWVDTFWFFAKFGIGFKSERKNFILAKINQTEFACGINFKATSIGVLVNVNSLQNLARAMDRIYLDGDVISCFPDKTLRAINQYFKSLRS